MSYDHQPHILKDRAPFKEWCGGTKPRTRVTVLPESVHVEVFKPDTNLHVGENPVPVRREQFLNNTLQLSVLKVGEFAMSAINARD